MQDDPTLHGEPDSEHVTATLMSKSFTGICEDPDASFMAALTVGGRGRSIKCDIFAKTIMEEVDNMLWL